MPPLLTETAIEQVLDEAEQTADEIALVLSSIAVQCDKAQRPEAATILRVLASDFINQGE